MDKTRKFLDRVLTTGIECGVLGPQDLLRHIDASMLATHLPKRLLANLIKAGLKNKSFDADLVLEVLGAHAFAEHMPVAALWTVVADTAAALLSGEERIVSKAKPAVAKEAEPAAKHGSAKTSKAKAADKDDKPVAADKHDKKAAKKDAKKDSKKDAEPKKSKSKKSKDKKESPPAVPPATPKKGSVTIGPAARPASGGGVPLPGMTQAVPQKKPNVSSRPETQPGQRTAKRAETQPGPLAKRPETQPGPQSKRSGTQPGLVAKAETARTVEPAEVTATTDSVGLAEFEVEVDIDVDTKVNAVPDGVVGGPPPRAPTFDPEVENALAGLEMEGEEIILDDEFEIAEEEILDESVHFDDASRK